MIAKLLGHPPQRSRTGHSVLTDLSDLLDRQAIIGALRANSKKKVLQDMAAPAASRTGVSERQIFETVLQRERLGSTGVGNGIAIPHGKLKDVTKLTGVFARLATPVDFDAIDGEPVDLVFMLLAPESAGADHLKALSRIARAFRDEVRVERLRSTSDPDAILALLVDSGRPKAA